MTSVKHLDRLLEASKVLSAFHNGSEVTHIEMEDGSGNCFNYRLNISNDIEVTKFARLHYNTSVAPHKWEVVTSTILGGLIVKRTV